MVALASLCAPGRALASPPDGAGEAVLIIAGALAVLMVLAGAIIFFFVRSLHLLLRSRLPGPLYCYLVLVLSVLVTAAALVPALIPGVPQELIFRVPLTVAQFTGPLLATLTLAARVWGKGPERARPEPWATPLFAVTLLAASGLWLGALWSASRCPLLPSAPDHSEPSEGGLEESLRQDFSKRDLYFRNAVPEPGGEESDHVVAISSPDFRDTTSVLLYRRPAPGAADQASYELVAERSVPDSWSLDLAWDSGHRFLAAWLSDDRSSLTVARLGSRLEIETTRELALCRCHNPLDEYHRLDAELDVRAGPEPRVEMELYPGPVPYVLTLDSSLRPRHRLAAALAALSDYRFLPGWPALLASLLSLAFALGPRLTLRRLERLARWEGRLVEGGTALETADGQAIPFTSKARRPAPLEPGTACTIFARASAGQAGGPYRQAGPAVEVEHVLEGSWPQIRARLEDHCRRASLITAAAIWLLSAAALDILLW